MISWVAPSANGVAISSYLIEIQNSASAWVTETTSCDGSSTTVKTNLYCIIPMTTLTSTFSLTYDTLVNVRVSATNSIGTSTLSSVNTSGAKIRTVPT